MPTDQPIPWKGKAKALQSDNDFIDIHTTLTYRHLHSYNQGTKDPFRVIALCDSDAFYAACEQVRLGLDPAIPLVVQQWDALIAVNYPARKFGISRMDKVKDAKKRCPELVAVHVATYKEGDSEPGYWDDPDTLTHKVSLDHYRRESAKVYQMFKEGLPEGEVERASIDEAFIDFTKPVRDELLRRYPYLAEVPPDAPLGKDTPLPPAPPIDWTGLGEVIPVYPKPKEEKKQEPGEDEGPESKSDDSRDDTEPHTTEIPPEPEPTWHDVALSIAADLMNKIRRSIYEKLGYTTSAGIARNKFLAKLTASYKKPNSQSILRNVAIPNYLRPMPFQKIRFLGGKLGKALAEEYDVSTVGDLLTVGLEEMQRRFGEDSIWVYEIVRGIDRSEVKEKPPVTKSMAASKNLPHPITKPSEGPHWIRVMAAELALRLKDAREVMPNLWPKTIVLSVRRGWSASRSKQAPFPFTRDPNIDVISAAGDKLWKELVGHQDSPQAAPLNITHVSLSFSGVASMEMGQRSIEGFLQQQQQEQQQVPAVDDEPTSDGANGHRRLKRKREVISESNPDGLERPHHIAGKRPPTLKREGEDTKDLNIDLQSNQLHPSNSFVCDRCGKRISLSAELCELDDGLDIKRDALEVLRVEHADFHLAQDLAKEHDANTPKHIIRPKPSSASGSGESRTKAQTTKKAKKAKGKGIEKFFTKS
ncbi:DNA/RNA polymerase [Panus rudis PR-1116 ss-1]|nr:DNA/RNA polymerase [Panus rudis PR-1116 ss-1]